MTLLKQDDGGVWISGPVVAAITAILLGLFGIIYQNQVTQLKSQDDKLWADGNDITQLKVTVDNYKTEAAKVEAAIGSINQTLTSIQGSIDSLKGSYDAQTVVIGNIKDGLRDTQKQVGDLNDILRPRAYKPGP